MSTHFILFCGSVQSELLLSTMSSDFQEDPKSKVLYMQRKIYTMQNWKNRVYVQKLKWRVCSSKKEYESRRNKFDNYVRRPRGMDVKARGQKYLQLKSRRPLQLLMEEVPSIQMIYKALPFWRYYLVLV